MDAFRFVQIVESYGADSARWPLAEREAATRFVANHPAAQEICAQSGVIDSLLDTVVSPPPSEFLRARILKAAATNMPAALRAANDRVPFRAIAATLLVGGLVGFLGGGLGPASVATAAPVIETEIALNSFETETTLAWLEESFTDQQTPLTQAE